MPITYDIDRDQRLVVATLRGVLTEAEIFGYQQEVWSKPEVSGYNELVDMTGVTQIESVSVKRMNELAYVSSSMDSRTSVSKLAIIATTDLHFGLGRMYQAQREMTKKGTKEVRVFRSREEALQWLGASSKAR